VPIYIRAGKSLPLTAAEVIVEFKRPPRETFGEIVPAASSHLRMRIGPDVAVGLGVRVKTQGERMVGHDVELMLTERPGSDLPPYQRLLGDAMRGVRDLFTRQDLVDAQWRIVDPVLDNVAPLHTYECGTWGPGEAAELTGRGETQSRERPTDGGSSGHRLPVRRRQHFARQRPYSVGPSRSS
jgi:glucose-6-phosphate 1-dehydrogenase